MEENKGNKNNIIPLLGVIYFTIILLFKYSINTETDNCNGIGLFMLCINTETNDHINNALSVICGIIVAIPAFIIPIFLEVFNSKIKDITANKDFIFNQIVKINNIKKFYKSIFSFIIFLIIQNYLKFFTESFVVSFVYSFNIVFTIYCICKTYNILDNIIFKDSADLIKECYDYYLEENKTIEEEKEQKIEKFFYCILKDLELHIKNSDIDYFEIIFNYANEFIKIDEFIKCIDKNSIVNLSYIFNTIIVPSIDNIEHRGNFFTRILELLINITKKYNKNEIKDIFYIISRSFSYLNNNYWKKHINEYEINYLHSSSIKNEYYRNLFKENCEKIINSYIPITESALEDDYNGLTNKENNNLYNIVYVLGQYIDCITNSLVSGNNDSIDYFLNALFSFFNNNKKDDDGLYIDFRYNFLTYYIENDKVFNSMQTISYQNSIQKQTNTKDNINIENDKIFNSILKNTILDVSYIMFEEYSNMYFNYLKDNKNNINNNVFILQIIKKIIKFNLTKETDFFESIEFNNSENVLYSIFRCYFIGSSYLYNYYYTIQTSLQEYFEKKDFYNVYDYPTDFKFLLILCNGISINNINKKCIVEVLELYCREKTCISYQGLKSFIDELIKNLDDIKFEKYEIFIKSVFGDEFYNTKKLEENKKDLKELFEYFKNNLSNKKQEILKQLPIDNSKFDVIKKLIKETYDKYKINNFLSLFFIKTTEKKKEVLNKQCCFISPKFDKAFFVKNTNYYGIETTCSSGFCKYFERQCFSNFLGYIENIFNNIKENKKVCNIENDFKENYLEKKEDYVIFTFKDCFEKLLNKCKIEQQDELTYWARNVYIDNYYEGVRFLNKSDVIVINKKFFDENKIDFDTLIIDSEEFGDCEMSVSASVKYSITFNNTKNNNNEYIKVFKLE